MQIEHHYNFETKLTPCINNIIKLAVTYIKKIKDSIKTCYNEVNVATRERL